MKNKVALVTGGSKGMGEAAVRKFVEAGASVAILDIDIDGANQLSKELMTKVQIQLPSLVMYQTNRK